MTSPKKFVVVTGVSSGIGLDTARLLLTWGFHVFGSLRRPEDAARLSAELGERFTPLLFDLRDADAIARAAEQVREHVGPRGLWALVNNAGVSTTGPLMYTPIEEVRDLLDVNVLGLLRVTQAFLPLLGATEDPTHPPGRVVNVSSISGRVTFPLVAAYAASKHAVEAISDGLRQELACFGVQVVVIEPGSVRTPIWEKIDRSGRYAHTVYGPAMERLASLAAAEVDDAAPARDVSQAILQAIRDPRPRHRVPLVWLWRTSLLIPDPLMDLRLCSLMGLPRRLAKAGASG